MQAYAAFEPGAAPQDCGDQGVDPDGSQKFVVVSTGKEFFARSHLPISQELAGGRARIEFQRIGEPARIAMRHPLAQQDDRSFRDCHENRDCH